MPTVHKVSDFKPAAGKIFDAARKEPQYVVRKGDLLVIQKACTPPVPIQIPLSKAQLQELNQELEALGPRGSRVIDEMRKRRAR